jgi:hypothetical protein
MKDCMYGSKSAYKNNYIYLPPKILVGLESEVLDSRSIFLPNQVFEVGFSVFLVYMKQFREINKFLFIIISFSIVYEKIVCKNINNFRENL